MKTVVKNSKNQLIKQIFQHPFIISLVIAFIWFILPSVVAHKTKYLLAFSSNYFVISSNYLILLVIAYYSIGVLIISYGIYMQLKIKQKRIISITVSILVGFIMSILFLYIISVFNYILSQTI